MHPVPTVILFVHRRPKIRHPRICLGAMTTDAKGKPPVDPARFSLMPLGKFHPPLFGLVSIANSKPIADDSFRLKLRTLVIRTCCAFYNNAFDAHDA